uniref:Protein HGH1 N-terminal domain-containing protein n=1 Tax=Anolis carolinensis TaxID=28377 RepID=A0A803TZM7_ANOCA
ISKPGIGPGPLCVQLRTGMDDQQAQELLAFLGPESRPDLRAQAVHCVAGLTVTPEGRRLLTTRPDFVEALLALTADPSTDVAKEAFHALINLAAEPGTHIILAKGLPDLLDLLLDPGSPLADQACALLSNFSREESAARQLLTALQREKESGLVALVDALGGADPQAGLHYLGPLLSNLSQLPEARKVLLDPSRCVIQKLLPFTQFMASDVRRGGIVGTLRNCCFEYRESLKNLSAFLWPLFWTLLSLYHFHSEEKFSEIPTFTLKVSPVSATISRVRACGGCRLGNEDCPFVPQGIPKARSKADFLPPHFFVCFLLQVLIAEEPPSGMENLLEVEIPTKVEEELQRLDQEEEEQLQKEGLAASKRPEPCPEGLRR